MSIVLALPEVKAFDEYVQNVTQGEARVATRTATEPEMRDGKHYWLVTVHEEHPTHSVRWHDFYVRVDGDEILSLNIISGQCKSLQAWRDLDKPQDRIRYGYINKNFHRIAKGMTEEDVAYLVGYPNFGRDEEKWIWVFDNTGMADKERYVIEFKNGVVTYAHCAGLHFARPDIPR